MDNQNIESALTGLANGINQYMGIGIQQNLNQAGEQRKLANEKTLKDYESGLDTRKSLKVEAYKATLEDAIKGKNSITLSQLKDDPEFAPLANMAPDARLEAKDLLGYLKDREKAKQEKQPKEFQYKAANYYKLASAGENSLSDLEKRMDLGSWAPLGRSEHTPEILRGQDWKQFMTARKQIAESYLRPATGATINPTEYEATDKIFIPLPGDSKAVKAGKAVNRLNLRNALKAEAEGKTVDLSVFKPVTEENAAQLAGGSAGTSGGWSIRPVSK